jgi:geranylgeranyl pyrophosphate synthase
LARYEYGTHDKSDALTLAAVIGSYRASVDAALSRLMSANTKLGEAAAEAVLNGGKRLRPSLTLIACEAVSGRFEQAVPVAVAYELAHSASLAQDDIIDESDLRRGSPTTQSKYGVANAILVSDVLLFKIFEVLGSYESIPITKGRLAAILGQLGAAARKAAEGEFLEVALAAKPHLTESDYLNAAGLKTGSLFAAATASGGIAGMADKKTVGDLYEYGYQLGISFQIVDDILDITGTSSETGKPVFKDLQNDATNIVLSHALENADHYKRTIIRSMIWKKSYGMADVQSLQNILEETGSIKYSRGLSARHATSARERLARLPSSAAKRSLMQLTEVLEHRQK